MTDTTLQITSNAIEQTIALGQTFAQNLKGGEVIALIGDLGTGKTHFIKGIAQGLHAAQQKNVTSPTFTLINEYDGRLTLYHIDAYRLDNAAQLEALGFDEICNHNSVVVVEWADRVWPLVSEFEPLTIKLTHQGPTQRNLNFQNLNPQLAQKLTNTAKQFSQPKPKQ